MNTVLEKIKKMGIVPVVVIENEKDAVPLADALCNGGLACAEVTFRTAAAGEAIRLMKEAHPEMLVGAGTVLTVEQVDRSVHAAMCIRDRHTLHFLGKFIYNTTYIFWHTITSLLINGSRVLFFSV